MIELSFTVGSALRRVFIRGREISLLTAETGHVPVVIHLDKLDMITGEHKKKIEGSEELLKEISKLNTEDEIAEDIVKDFKKTGWRLLTFKKT